MRAITSRKGTGCLRSKLTNLLQMCLEMHNNVSDTDTLMYLHLAARY